MTTEARKILAQQVTEADWQGYVVATATLFGWSTYHVYDSRRDNPGWPDLVLCRPPHLLFVELKSEGGRVTQAQQKWLDDLKASGQFAAVWRPSEQEAVTAILRHGVQVGTDGT